MNNYDEKMSDNNYANKDILNIQSLFDNNYQNIIPN